VGCWCLLLRPTAASSIGHEAEGRRRVHKPRVAVKHRRNGTLSGSNGGVELLVLLLLRLCCTHRRRRLLWHTARRERVLLWMLLQSARRCRG
jgi:hypothetical protein